MRRARIRLAAAVAAVGLAATVTPTAAQPAPEEVRIVRDEFGVPHVFADTANGAAYGAGYALAQDRLWQMHVFRRIAKGRLSELLGPVVVDIDRTIRFFTYTQEERARRFATYPEDLQALLQAFVDGINAWMSEVRLDPSKVPFEFHEFGELDALAEAWTADDSLALQDVLILAFGSGGGNELAYAELLHELIDRHGRRQGLRMWRDLIRTNDPDAPTTIPRGYPYERRSTFARVGEADSRRGLEDDARISLEADGEGEGGTRAAAAPQPATGALEQLGLIPDLEAAVEGFRGIRTGLRELRRMFRFGSNAQIVGPGLSEHGNSLQTGGPQVGYLLPQWLADFGMHGGGIDTTGMTFAGAGPAVLIGRGPGYAWTTTTGASDLTDTYVERLNPDDAREYEFRGEFEPMECRTETHSVRGAPFERQEICRTRHGPVFAFDEENGVAYSLRYAWFNREGQTVEGFFRYNEVTSVEDFATFANYLSSNHNMFYTDDRGNYGYWHPGNHPRRVSRIDLRLPQDGRGGSEWRGLLDLREVPHAVNFPRGWLANWNNQPAQPWHRERGHPALDNVLDLEDALDPRGPALPDPLRDRRLGADRSLDFDDLSANLRYAAFKHHRHTSFREFLPEPRTLEGVARKALRAVRSWDGFLVDRDEDGRYDHAGRSIVDRWVSRLRERVFVDDLGDLQGFAREDLLWHVLNPNDRLRERFDWLGGKRAEAEARRAFRQAVGELAEEFGSDRPVTWREEAELEHYQRLNADLFHDLADPDPEDSGHPGDVPDHIEMDRGTYNHVVVFLDPPAGAGPLGRSASRAGSVIPPGQSGFIGPLGQEDPHYEDQLALYEEWGYKPMPLTLDEALELAESEETIPYDG